MSKATKAWTCAIGAIGLGVALYFLADLSEERQPANIHAASSSADGNNDVGERVVVEKEALVEAEMAMPRIQSEEVDTAPSRSVIPQENFDGSGSIIAHGTLKGQVELRWKEIGSEHEVKHSVRADSGVWTHSFAPGEYHLTQALADGREWAIHSECVVSQADPIQSIEVFAPDGVWLDVVDGTTKSRVLSAKVTAKVGATLHEELNNKMRGKRLQKGGRMRIMKELGLWSLSDAGMPVLLPSIPHGGGVDIHVPGYKKAEWSGIEAPGVYTVEVTKIQAFAIKLMGASSARDRYEVEVTLPKEGINRRFTEVEPNALLSIPYSKADSARIQVSRSAELGLGVLIVDDEFEIAPDQKNIVINLSSPKIIPSAGSITLTVAASEELNKMHTWYVMLRPTDVPNTPEYEQYPQSRLAGWGALTAQKHYRNTFSGIYPGEYELLLSPIDFRQTVTVREGEETKIEINLPGLAELRVWPVNKDGRELPSALGAGRLVWKTVNEESKKRERTDPLYMTNKGPSEWVVDFQRGFAHSAEMKDGFWLVRTFRGETVKIYYMGPPELLGNAKIVELDDLLLDEPFEIGAKRTK